MSDDFRIVQRRRYQLGLSWREAAALAGISPRTWADIEMGDWRADDDTLAKVEATLQMPPGMFKALEYEVTDPELADIRREMMDMIAELSTRERLGPERLEEIRVRMGELQARLQAAEG